MTKHEFIAWLDGYAAGSGQDVSAIRQKAEEITQWEAEKCLSGGVSLSDFNITPLDFEVTEDWMHRTAPAYHHGGPIAGSNGRKVGE